ncbi:MAG TPA: ADP-ribosylglycohydrolase family protein [Polyangiales bacterium]|nr:ADP-ribosylglycohydrolase family protein [Polyangiales bacterium]
MTPEHRAQLSLDGLSVGDAFGARFFGATETVVPKIDARQLPLDPWLYTDDTEMAISVVEVLESIDEIDQDLLVRRFAARMNDMRGYGGGTYRLLCAVQEGGAWRRLSAAGFRGVGSFGNGAAMRVAPLGAYFADRALEHIIEQARLSAEVTHMHAEGIAGAVAVAVAAALAWQRREQSAALGSAWLEAVRDATPAGATRGGIQRALELDERTTVLEAAEALGNGFEVSAADTVPLCLWVASRQSHDFSAALWETVRALGDRDTTCAIVGGIVALHAGPEGIPATWLERREALPARLRLTTR